LTKFVDSATTSLQFGSAFDVSTGLTYTITVIPTDTGWRRTPGLQTELSHGVAGWQASDTRLAPCGGVGEPICPPVPQWENENEFQIDSLSPYWVRVGWGRVISGKAISHFSVQASSPTSAEIGTVNSGDAWVKELPITSMQRGENITITVVAIDVDGGTSEPLTINAQIPNWNQNEAQNPATLGSTPVYGPPPIGWVVRSGGGVAGVSVDLDADPLAEYVPALYTSGAVVDANGFIDTLALFGTGSSDGFLLQPTNFALQMQNPNFSVRQDFDLGDISWWDADGVKIQTAGSSMRCMRLSEAVLHIVEGIPTVRQPGSGSAQAVICRHLAGIEEVASQGGTWYLQLDDVKVRNFVPGHGDTVVTTSGHIYEGCVIVEVRPNSYGDVRMQCDYKVIGGYSVNFGAGPSARSLGYISTVATCETYPVQVFAQAGGPSIAGNGFNPCSADPGAFDTEEAKMIRLATLVSEVPQVDYLLAYRYVRTIEDGCIRNPAACPIDSFAKESISEEYLALFKANGGCAGVPSNFDEECKGGGSSWDWAVEIGTDILIGLLCAAALSTGLGAVVLCGLIAAALGGVVGNLVAGRPWHEGVVVDALVGGISAGVFDKLGGAIRRLRSLRTACKSFSADTEVVMATGALRPISQIEVGNLVMAADPETGKSGPRQVTAVWPHHDDLVDLLVQGGSITTTEDHEFWNVTDQAWQESQHLDAGDQLLSADGDLVTVVGLDWTTSHFSIAYDLTIDDLHTYYVSVADTDVLVHNTGTCDDLASALAKGPNSVEINGAELKALWMSAPDSMSLVHIPQAKWDAWIEGGWRYDPDTRTWSAPYAFGDTINPDGTYRYPADEPEIPGTPIYLDSIDDLPYSDIEYIYVVRRNGELVYSTDGSWGHWGLAQGKDVRAAGMFKKPGPGQFRVSNESGHFFPVGPGNQAAATEAFLSDQVDIDFYPDQYEELFF